MVYDAVSETRIASEGRRMTMQRQRDRMTVNWTNLNSLGSQGWLAIAAWVALVVLVGIAVWANRQIKKNRQLRTEQIRPQVAMFIEPNASDWHIIELVVRNFGQTAAHDIRFEFANPPTVAVYENHRNDGTPEVAELNLPSELAFLAPGQEWRMVWDSAISRETLGGSIRSRFDGTLTYADRPRPEGKKKSGGWNKRQTFESKVCLDWASLQPVQRLELMTSHDLAKREKQKLELLRHVLTYFHYASKETRPEVFRAEIERMKRAVDETQDRWRTRESDQTTELSFPWINDGLDNSLGSGLGNGLAVDLSGRHRVNGS